MSVLTAKNINMGQNKVFSRSFQYPTVVYLMPHSKYKSQFKHIHIDENTLIHCTIVKLIIALVLD